MAKFQAGAILSLQVMDCQVHSIGKAIRPLFADLFTYYELMDGRVNSTQIRTIMQKCGKEINEQCSWRFFP